ncbi:MAG: hypothetical protein PPP58_12695 [Natronomonas sp.]
MSALRMFTAAFVLMALSLPLISLGASSGIEAVSFAGLAALIVGALIPVVVRFTTENPDVAA